MLTDVDGFNVKKDILSSESITAKTTVLNLTNYTQYAAGWAVGHSYWEYYGVIYMDWRNTPTVVSLSYPENVETLKIAIFAILSFQDHQRCEPSKSWSLFIIMDGGRSCNLSNSRNNKRLSID